MIAVLLWCEILFSASEHEELEAGGCECDAGELHVWFSKGVVSLASMGLKSLEHRSCQAYMLLLILLMEDSRLCTPFDHSLLATNV